MSNTSNVYENSVFIPRVFLNISKEKIASMFEKLDLAMVRQIDFVPKQNSKGDKYKYNNVYVHLDWIETKASISFRGTLFGPKKEVKLVYDDPLYWTVLQNTSAIKDEEAVPSSTLNISAKPWLPKTQPKTQKVSEPLVIAGVEQETPPTSRAAFLLKKIKAGNKFTPYTPPYTPPNSPLQRLKI